MLKMHQHTHTDSHSCILTSPAIDLYLSHVYTVKLSCGSSVPEANEFLSGCRANYATPDTCSAAASDMDG